MTNAGDLWNPEEKWQQPKTAAEYIACSLDWARRGFDATMNCEPDKGPGTASYNDGITATVCGWQQAALMEMVRLLSPEVADRLAAEIGDSLDDGGVVAELLAEWRKAVRLGGRISDYRGYRSIFDTAGGEA